MTDIGCAVGENGQMAGRFLKAGQFEPGILSRQVTRIRIQSVRVAAFELFEDGVAARGIVNDHKTPRLAEAHGRRQTRRFNEAFQCARRQRLGPKTPNVTAPDKKIMQPGTKIVIEAHVGMIVGLGNN